MQLNTYTKQNPIDDLTREKVGKFLEKHLEQYGDPLQQISLAISYALGENNKPGGGLIVGKDSETGEIIGAVVVNATGMEGYIPENILVYIATHNNYRGQGLGKKLMQEAIASSKGSMALHCEPDNPARKLYEKLGFTSKYLEMRLSK
ncbi:GNAT family N-acetyltransferase [Planobacterium oryzisoli]|uniref:GNAT family N-acetyltransferase n=1 Tax=Planobacterium oryzisoli TaxID=2771435 RepID=A0A931E5Z6_9FLAO|nr:GNAT family N-acetyltransferase [Planobacterium oryzisoli]MBF5027320.1 GNAT family N-acetyltransferase [Planobacterium oryzisoli]